jgi:hypothetical protein
MLKRTTDHANRTTKHEQTAPETTYKTKNRTEKQTEKAELSPQKKFSALILNRPKPKPT